WPTIGQLSQFSQIESVVANWLTTSFLLDASRGNPYSNRIRNAHWRGGVMAVVNQQYPFLPAGATVCTVSQLTDEVRRTLEAGFESVWVEGEISNLARPTSGHIYLTLKDANASLRCVIYRQQAEQLTRGFHPRDGIEVVAFGRISVYPPRGEYQLLIDRMYP